MQAISDFLKRMGAPRLAAMGAVALTLVGLFAFIMLRASTPQMAVLFSDLAASDAAAIAKSLDAQGIRYEVKGDGSLEGAWTISGKDGSGSETLTPQ